MRFLPPGRVEMALGKHLTFSLYGSLESRKMHKKQGGWSLQYRL